MDLTRVCSPATPTTVESFDFILYKGITFRPIFKFKDSDGTALPISGKIITFHISDKTGIDILTVDSNNITANGSTVVITDDLNGIVEVLITDEETLLLDFDCGYWWITLTLLNGDILLRGKGSIYLKEPYE